MNAYSPIALPVFAANAALVARHEDLVARAIARHVHAEGHRPCLPATVEKPAPPVVALPKPPAPKPTTAPPPDLDSLVLAHMATVTDWTRTRDIRKHLRVRPSKVADCLRRMERAGHVERGHVIAGGQKADVWRCKPQTRPSGRPAGADYRPADDAVHGRHRREIPL